MTNRLLLASLWCASMAIAHHSFDAEFDANRPVTLQGVVTKFEFIDPHGWIYLEGKDETGKTGTWAAETANVSLSSGNAPQDDSVG